MRPATPSLNFAQQAAPSSPPETPVNSKFDYDNVSPRTRRYGVLNFPRPTSQPRDSLQSSDFGYNPSIRLEDFSPRSSSPSSDSSGSPPRSLSPEPMIPEHSDQGEASTMRSRVVMNGNFTIEEIHESHMHTESDDALSVIRPDQYEDAESVGALSNGARRSSADTVTRSLADELKNLTCEPTLADHDAWILQQRLRKRKNRLSSGSIHKRTLSQSIGSDTDEEDLQFYDANEAGSSARRLRRKVAGERTSLIFDDPPQRIIELDENDTGDSGAVHGPEADDVPEIEEALMHALPYYRDSSSMELDSSEDWRDDHSM